jgi:hypothetical protein
VSFIEIAVFIYFAMFSGPIIRQEDGTKHVKVSTILGGSMLGLPVTW